MTRTALCALVIAALAAGASLALAGSVTPSEATLEKLRQSGDVAGQRRHVWEQLAAITAPRANRPAFQAWHGEGELFSDAPSGRPGLAGFSRTGILDTQSPDVPMLTYTLYNDAAYNHITRNHLNQAATLERLRKTASANPAISKNRDVPAFPAQSVVLKTVWWPVARDGLTALPVWDPARNPAGKKGNPYTSWKRVVAVDPRAMPNQSAAVAIDFAGSNYPKARRVGLSAFDHVSVDGAMARAMMADPSSRKAALIALGRPLAAGDHLVLVAANVAAREIPDWIWSAFWWHDQPEQGPYAADRPASVTGPWRNYLMQAAFDAQKPLAAGKTPHITFNPWLEGRFPDGGHGGGIVSNCMACHHRASYPAVPFLPVTRGKPDLRGDAAYASDQLRTSFLWGLAMHARPKSITNTKPDSR